MDGARPWSRVRKRRVCSGQHVVEMVGDLGPPTLQHLAAEQTQRLAGLTGAEPMFLRVPGVIADPAIRKALLAHDSHARQTLDKLDALDFAVTGIGAGGIVAAPAGGGQLLHREAGRAGQETGCGRRTQTLTDQTTESRHLRRLHPRPP
jgi:DNA-binding transcriptional regulator LsrR (DeoR family)